MKTVDTTGGPARLAQKSINGNLYTIIIYLEPDKRHHDYLILVYADGLTGADHGFPDHPFNVFDTYDEMARHTVHVSSDDTLESHISEAVNSAVCKLERKQDEEREFAEKVNAALEANKEVHEGIDYELDRNANTDLSDGQTTETEALKE